MTKHRTSAAIISTVLALLSGSALAEGARTSNASTSYGVAIAGPTVPMQTIDVSKIKQPHVNVRCGDVVVFRNGARSFTWKFDVIGHRPIELAKIAPQGFSDKPLKVYVASNDFEAS